MSTLTLDYHTLDHWDHMLGQHNAAIERGVACPDNCLACAADRTDPPPSTDPILEAVETCWDTVDRDRRDRHVIVAGIALAVAAAIVWAVTA